MRKISLYLISLLTLLLTSLVGCSSATTSSNSESGTATALAGPAFVLFYADN